MKQLYKENTANYPRQDVDVLFADYSNEYKYSGFMHEHFKFIEDYQLTDEVLWQRFVAQYRMDADFDAGWRGEYWGKMMRGACFVYSYSKNPVLYGILEKTVKDMMASADPDGRISSYGRDHEFDGWDMWSRKYVLLGMQYFLEICTDPELASRIIASMRGQADYIISKIGKKEDGKKPINSATRHWRGLNSSSILEPIVRLYSLTKEEKYLDFAEYIVNEGGTDVANIFDLAYENEFYPYQYPVTKAYEMTSCFEGLLEFYRIKGNPRYRTALINYANRILESDFTVIGCCGTTHELFDHSTVRQASTMTGDDLRMQETCVTVTLMKFFYQLTLLTGDPKYVDAFEISLYNAYLGAFNTEKVIEPTIKERAHELHVEPMPFDSYSPLTAGTRGVGLGGLKIMSDKHYYGCCACIGSAGIGLVPKMQLLTSERGFALNLYINGTVKSETPTSQRVVFDIKTEYPRNEKITVRLSLDRPESFEIKLRVPEWSKNTEIKVCGKDVNATDGYVTVCRRWHCGDEIELTLDMRTEAISPIPYGTQILMNNVIWGHNYIIPSFDKEDPMAHKHIALRRGPIMLAQENRLGYSVDDPIEVAVNPDGYVNVTLPETDTAPYAHIVEAMVPMKNGGLMTTTDYASAGKLWTEESKMAVWMLTK